MEPINLGNSNSFEPLSSMGQTNLDASEIIDLDLAHASEDPATALLSIVALKAGCAVEELVSKKRDFRLEKGFSPEPNSGKPIPIHAYSNPPGPDCYYLVRHWRVKVKDADDYEVELHFTKKIYTSVQVPHNLNRSIQAQQQYIAALAARTYANIQESQMQKVGAGKEDVLYTHVRSHISKVAKDRFVTLEMFNNEDKVVVNATRKKEIDPNLAVDRVRFRFRAAKEGAEGETKADGFYDIVLDQKTFPLKKKIYQLTPGESASAHVRNVVKMLNMDEVMENIRDGMKPSQAFADFGLNIYEVKEAKEEEIKSKTQSFYSQLAYFNNAESVESLMSNVDPDQYELSREMLEKIVPDHRTFLEKFLSTKKEVPFFALANLEEVLEYLPRAEKEEARKFLDAAEKVYGSMVKDHEALIKNENELALINQVDVDEKNRAAREAVLNKMNEYLDKLNRLLPIASSRT